MIPAELFAAWPVFGPGTCLALGLLLVALEAFWPRGWLLGIGLGALLSAIGLVLSNAPATLGLPLLGLFGLPLAIHCHWRERRALHEFLVTTEHRSAEKRDDV